jgi:hypothetical protein
VTHDIANLARHVERLREEPPYLARLDLLAPGLSSKEDLLHGFRGWSTEAGARN